MISIIIILKNDLGIVNTITSINKLDYCGDVEIIIVDRSTIIYPKIKSAFPLKWVKYDPKGKQYTIPEQRNMGINEARGDIVVFIDANCVPQKKWLTELVKPINEEKEKIVMGRTGSIGKVTSNDLSYENLKDTKYVNEAFTINLAIKRSIFNKIGLFDEKFEYGSDVDWSWKAIDSKFKIRYAPKAIIYHDWGNLNQEIKRALKYGEARVKLYKKHRDKLINLLDYQKDLFSIYSIIFFIYTIFLLPLILTFPYFPLFLLIPIIKYLKINPLKKMIFDWFWGLGLLKELLFPYKK